MSLSWVFFTFDSMFGFEEEAIVKCGICISEFVPTHPSSTLSSSDPCINTQSHDQTQFSSGEEKGEVGRGGRDRKEEEKGVEEELGEVVMGEAIERESRESRQRVARRKGGKGGEREE